MKKRKIEKLEWFKEKTSRMDLERVCVNWEVSLKFQMYRKCAWKVFCEVEWGGGMFCEGKGGEVCFVDIPANIEMWVVNRVLRINPSHSIYQENSCVRGWEGGGAKGWYW